MISNEVVLMNRWLKEGLSKTEIARRLGRSRQTIYNWIENGAPDKSRANRPSKLDPYKTYIEGRLETFDLPATVLLREIRKKGYTGGITILREFVATIKNRQVRRLVDRFETEPGRQAQLDWASCGTILHEGRRRRLSLLILVLGYSRLIWGRFVVSERRPVMLELLEDAFREIGGVSKEVLIDNMKQAVEVARTADSPARLQLEFGSFADHWGFEAVACPPYWPRAKGKVERAVSYVKRSFLEGRSFETLEDLNGQLRAWLADTANVRIHGTTGERPVDRLAEDLKNMLPVQKRAFPASQSFHRLVDQDGRLSYGGVRYSVDPSILSGRRGEPVTLTVSTDDRIRIHHNGDLVGEHVRMPSGSPPQDDPLHEQARRRLREAPRFEKPRGKTPRFDQTESVDLQALVNSAPRVESRPLATYEGMA